MKLLENAITLAICLYHEARGESQEGQVAVTHVILNRVRESNESLASVVYKPWQFSWANKGARPPIADYESFMQCVKSAMVCFDERLEGKDLQDANHYFAEYIPAPKWAADMKLIKKIGKHLFYRSEK